VSGQILRRVSTTTSVSVEDADRFWQLVASDGNAVGDVVHPVQACSAVSLSVSGALSRYFGGAPVLHLGQRLRIHQASRPGETLSVDAKVTRVSAEASGYLVQITAGASTDRGQVIDAGVLFLARVVEGGELVDNARAWSQIGPPGRPVWAPRRQYLLTEADIAAFASCTGDDQAIHLSNDWARLNGLPGIIAHGMHTFAMCFESVAEEADRLQHRIRSISLRFARPVLPGVPVTIESASVPGAVVVRAIAHGRALTRAGAAALVPVGVAAEAF
jgi:acyl dehydratase